jgi:uncharacterized protein YndB with AHSA1/START domain
MTTTQCIQKELILKAPRAAVWNALTTPEGWTGWFSDGVQGEFKVGETLTLDFGPHGLCWAVVLEREEMTRFAYKWHPGEDCPLDKYPESEMTTVRFTLEDHADGTKLILEESGFEHLPEDRRASALLANTDGWKWELAELKAFAERGDKQLLSQKELVKERVYPTSAEKLWDLIATPEGLKKWFVLDVVGDFEPGKLTTLVFQSNDATVSGPMRIVESRRPELFSFRWHPGEEEGCTWDKYPEDEATQTTFTLTAVEGGTKLTVVESGFDKIPSPRRNQALDSNSGGWNWCLDEIGKTLERGA